MSALLFLVAGFVDVQRGDLRNIGAVTSILLALCSERERRAFYIVSLENALREDWDASTVEGHRRAWSKISELLPRMLPCDVARAERSSGTRIA